MLLLSGEMETAIKSLEKYMLGAKPVWGLVVERGLVQQPGFDVCWWAVKQEAAPSATTGY